MSCTSPIQSKYEAVTAQQIADFEETRRLRREKLTLYQRPFATLYTFSAGTVVFLRQLAIYLLSHPLFLFAVLPLGLLWYILEFIPGPYTAMIDKIEFCVEFFVWWVGLGILSSIGLGSGLQSGVLFLFPHIIKTCLAAQTCKTLDFDSFSNMWFRSPESLFQCPELTYESTPVTFFGLWKKVAVVCFLQASGTAIGEIPPYWVTRAARLAAISAGTSQSDEVPEELETNSRYSWLNKAKTWMIRFLRHHGFYGVLLMASYPNLAFDLCGICCGHYLMPFWTFFGATFVGKAVIRNGYQSIIYVTLCSEKYLELMIQFLQFLAPDSLQIDQAIREVIEDGRASFHKLDKNAPKTPSKHSGLGMALMMYWQIFMSLLLLSFFLSCISQFAQYYQLTLDQQESELMREKLPASIKKMLSSPKTGRFKLPPPSLAGTGTITSEKMKVSARNNDSEREREREKKQERGERYGERDPSLVFERENWAANLSPPITPVSEPAQESQPKISTGYSFTSVDSSNRKRE